MSEFTGIRWKQKPLYTIDGEERKLDGADIMPLTHAPWIDSEEADGSITIDSLAEAMHTDVAALEEKAEFSKDGIVVSIEDGKAYKGTLDNMMSTEVSSLNSLKISADTATIGCAVACSVSANAVSVVGDVSVSGKITACNETVKGSLCVKGDIYQKDGTRVADDYIHCSQNPVLKAWVDDVTCGQTLEVSFANGTFSCYAIDSYAVIECENKPLSPKNKIYNIAKKTSVCTKETVCAFELPDSGGSLSMPEGFMETCLCTDSSTGNEIYSITACSCCNIFMAENLSEVASVCICKKDGAYTGISFQLNGETKTCTAEEYKTCGSLICFGQIEETVTCGPMKVMAKDVELVTKSDFDALSVNCIHNTDCSVCIATLGGGIQMVGNINIACDLTICGSIYQCGSSYTTHAEDLNVNDATITVRANAESAMVAGDYAGITVSKYDGTNDMNIFVDNEGVARLGKTGSLQPFALRNEEACMTDGALVCWNAADKRLDTACSINCYVCDLICDVCNDDNGFTNYTRVNGCTIIPDKVGIVCLTQEEYDAMECHNPSTLYLIKDGDDASASLVSKMINDSAVSCDTTYSSCYLMCCVNPVWYVCAYPDRILQCADAHFGLSDCCEWKHYDVTIMNANEYASAIIAWLHTCNCCCIDVASTMCIECVCMDWNIDGTLTLQVNGTDRSCCMRYRIELLNKGLV